MSRASAVFKKDASEPTEQRMRIGCSFYAFVLIGVTDAVLGVALPGVMAHYAVTQAVVSVLFPASSLGFLVAAFTSGLLFERLGQRSALMLGVALLLFGALCFAVLVPFALLPLALLCIGSGEAILDAGLNAYFARSPASGKLLNYLHAFYGVGALLGPLLAGALIALAWGWNTTYGVLAGGVALALLGIAVAFPQRETAATDGQDRSLEKEGAQTSGNTLIAALRLPLVMSCSLFLLLYVGTEVSLGVWSYSLLLGRNLASALVVSWMISGYWLGLTFGRFVIGRLAARLDAKRMLSTCLAGAACGVALVWGGPNGMLVALGLFVAGFFLGPIYPAIIAFLGASLPGRLSQSAIGFATSMASVGAAFFPWLVGALGQHVGLWVLFPIALTLTVIMLGLWWMVQRRPQQKRDA